jgi:DNA helicase-2/ATP-dependent DNA helicase PcrA
VLALYDGNFPADMACGSADSIEEERRLLYVAITRARRQLHLYVPIRYYHRPHGRDDAHGYGKASRFLTPAVRDTCEIVTLDEPMTMPAAGGEAGPRRITVSVDALFS